MLWYFLRKKNIGIILLILVIVIGIGIFGIPIFTSPTPFVPLTKIDESIVPSGTIIHLSDKDFKEFPTLASVIRDNNQRGETWADGIHYSVKLSWEEKERFISRYPMPSINYTTGQSETYFEYKGKYYSYKPPIQP